MACEICLVPYKLFFLRGGARPSTEEGGNAEENWWDGEEGEGNDWIATTTWKGGVPVLTACSQTAVLSNNTKGGAVSNVLLFG